MHPLSSSIDVNNATAVAMYYETHAIPQRFNAGIIAASVVVSILGSYASLFLLGKRTSNSGTRNIVLLILAATTMAFVGIWSMHFIGMYMKLEATPLISYYIRYNPGFAVFSFIAPAIALIVSFLFLDTDADGFRFWKVILAGTLTGCTVALMHYSASFYCNFNVTFAPAQVVGSILLACVLCIVGFTAFFRFRYQWQDSWWKRGACAFSIGLGVSGMHYVGVSGTSYRVKWDNMNGHNLMMGRGRNLTLVCVIAVISVLILLGIAVAALGDVMVKRNSRKKARMLVVASATFDRAGRLMVNGDGTLPLITVQERTLRRSQVLQALDQRSNVFHWLYAISWDWSIIAPYIDAIASRMFEAEKKNYIANQRNTLTSFQKARRLFAKGGKDTMDDSKQSHTSLSDFRDKVIDAAHRLSQDLDVPLPSIGVFYDQVLPTGTRKAAEKARAKEPFILRSESMSSGIRMESDEELRVADRPASIFGKGEEEAEGVTMFIVREIDQDEVSQLAKRGYRFTETRFLGNILADRHGVIKDEMESTLEALRLYAKRGTKPIVQPGGYYTGLFCVRPSPLHQNGNLDVLVYDFARHQIPAFRLPQVTRMTSEIHFFLKSLDQVAVENVLVLCQKDSTQLGEQRKRIEKLLKFNVKVADQEKLIEEQVAIDALIQFQQSLFTAIKALIAAMYFFPDLVQTARFSSKMVELPSSLVDKNSVPAHLVLVQAVLPMERLPRRGQGLQPSAPFVFTPYNLFAKTQMMMLGGPPAEEFEREVINDLERRYKLQEPSVELIEVKTNVEEGKEVDKMSDLSRASRPVTHVLTFKQPSPPSAAGATRLSILEEQSVNSTNSPAASAIDGAAVKRSPSQSINVRRFTRSGSMSSISDKLEQSNLAKSFLDSNNSSSDAGNKRTTAEIEVMESQLTATPHALSPRKKRAAPQSPKPPIKEPEPSTAAVRPSLIESISSRNLTAQVAAMESISLATPIPEAPSPRSTSDQWQIQQLDDLEKHQPNLLLGILPNDY